MTYYLVQVAYTPERWVELVRQPQDQMEAVRPAVERLGGRIEGAWFAFGEYDIVAVFQMPDNVSAAALSMALSAGGGVKGITTTLLMTMDEGLEAMKQSGGVPMPASRPPSPRPTIP